MNQIPEKAKYRGGPSRHEVDRLRREYFHPRGEDAFRGKRFGGHYGQLFVVMAGGGLVPVVYGADGREVMS